MYKISKFTYTCENVNRELLMYNTYEGTKSFSKIKNKQSKKYFETGAIDKLSNNTLNELLKSGIIIKENVDECKKLYDQYLSVINQKSLTLTINPTEYCNFRCKYCYETFINGQMTIENQDNVIKYVRENIHNYSQLYVSWFGGEPLLGMECIQRLSEEFIKICKFYKKKYSASIITNGYLLNIKNFNKLLESKVKRYQITLDGVKSIHDKQRITYDGQPTFDIIMKNLKEIKKSSRKDFSVNIRTNVTNEIFNNFEEYIENVSYFCENDNRFFVSVFKVGDWLNKVKDEIKLVLIDDISIMRDIYIKILKSNKKINIHRNFLDPGGAACYAGKKNNFLICSDGSVHKCTVNFGNTQSIVGKIVNGSLLLNDNYFSMIINSSNCKNYLKCFYAPLCLGDPCPLKERGKSNCPYNKENLDIILQIEDKYKEFRIIE